VLVGHNIVFVFRIQRLVLWRDMDVFLWQMGASKVLEEICVVWFVKMKMRC